MAESATRPSALPAVRPALAPVHVGAERVHLAEELYVRLVGVGFAILLAGCAVTLWFATLENGSPGFTTSLFVGTAAILAITGLARTRRVYRGLRARRSLQLAPAVLGALAVLLDGPDSQCWWIALPLLWIVAAVSSTRLTFAAAMITGLAFLAGTIMAGEPLIGAHDSGVLPAAVGLPAYTLIGHMLIDGFVGLVLGRSLHAPLDRQPPQRPLRVPNLALPATSRVASDNAQPSVRRQPRSPSRLTSRQLEVTLLLRDGLRQTEIAVCLGISQRQVERLLATARDRVGAATTNELVAMLCSGALNPLSTAGIDLHADQSPARPSSCER